MGVVLIGLAIFGYAEVWGADWKLFASTVNGDLYYDTQSITHPYTNIVGAWIRFNYTDKGVLDAVRTMSLVKGIENLNNSIGLWEINCLEKKSRTSAATYYDNRGGDFFLQWSTITMGFYPSRVGSRGFIQSSMQIIWKGGEPLTSLCSERNRP